jgi:hypothetical protein
LLHGLDEKIDQKSLKCTTFSGLVDFARTLINIDLTMFFSY